MNHLTEIKHGVPVTNTRVIARAIKTDNTEVVNAVNKLLEDYPELSPDSVGAKHSEFEPVFIQYQGEYRGQKFTAYQMNEAAFYLLLPRFRTKRAKAAYLEFVKAFMQMKHALLQAEANKSNLLFQQIRTDGKRTRHSFTDAIQAFAEYSKEQGSTGHIHYFGNFTKAINKALDIKPVKGINTRDSLTTEQQEQLTALENKVVDCVMEGIDSGLTYQQIKANAKVVIKQK